MMRFGMYWSVPFLPMVLAPLVSGSGGIGKSDAKVRIGTYETRAVAIAFAASAHNPVKENMAEYEKAKAAGDKAIMKKLETWGERFQRQLHFQGFGGVPVDELLAPVRDELEHVADERQLAAIAMSCEFTNADVELVGITDDPVRLFAPSEQTLQPIREIRKRRPTPLAEIDAIPRE